MLARFSHFPVPSSGCDRAQRDDRVACRADIALGNDQPAPAGDVADDVERIVDEAITKVLPAPILRLPWRNVATSGGSVTFTLLVMLVRYRVRTLLPEPVPLGG